MKEGGTAGTVREISSGGVIFRRAGGTVEVALVSVKGGKVWGLPKGLVEKGENIARTAHREVKEETGLDGRILKNLGSIKYFFTFREGDKLTRHFKIVYFFLMEYTGGDVAFHDEEVTDCRWFKLDYAARLLKYEDEKDILRKARKALRELGYLKPKGGPPGTLRG